MIITLQSKGRRGARVERVAIADAKEARHTSHSKPWKLHIRELCFTLDLSPHLQLDSFVYRLQTGLTLHVIPVAPGQCHRLLID